MTAPYLFDYTPPIELPAARPDAFRALTEATALSAWFADGAEVEPREGGAFRFWGKGTLGAATRQSATQRLKVYAPVETVSFFWRLLDRDSTVTWTLAEAGGNASKIRIRHEFELLPDGARMKELIDDMWRLHAGNLCFYLKGDSSIFRPDLDDPSPEVRIVMTIAARPSRVFAALIEPEQIKKWFPAPAPEVEPKVGGKYGFGMSYEVDGRRVVIPPMKILAFEQDRRLAITWPDWRGDAGVPDQRVEWTLEDLGGATRLTLVHSGFVRAYDVSDYPFGWGEFMDQLAKVATGVA